MASTYFNGPVRSGEQETDGQIFIPGIVFNSTSGTWTKTRDAAGDYKLRKTAGAATTHVNVCLNQILFNKIGSDPVANYNRQTDARGNRERGIEITSIDVAYAIGTADLTSLTLDLHQTTYSADVPAVVSTVGGTLTGASLTAAQDTAALGTVTLGTPYIIGNNTDNVGDWLELAVVDPGTSVFDLYGVFVNFNYNLL